jgi:hypothetical protein
LAKRIANSDLSAIGETDPEEQTTDSDDILDDVLEDFSEAFLEDFLEDKVRLQACLSNVPLICSWLSAS